MNVKKIGFVVDSTIGDNINVNFLSDICVVPLSIIINNKEFTEKIDNSFLLECVRQKKQVTTSQP